jgi:hypothetical protein
MDGLRDTLRRTGGIHAVSDRLAQPFPEIARIADAALPLIASALHSAVRRFGVGEIGCRHMIEQLQRLGGGEMAVAVMSPGDAYARPGEALLDLILPQPGARKAVVNAVARKSGTAVWLASAALPVLAMLVGGYVSARALEKPEACRFDELLAQGDDSDLAVVLADAGVTT